MEILQEHIPLDIIVTAMDLIQDTGENLMERICMFWGIAPHGEIIVTFVNSNLLEKYCVARLILTHQAQDGVVPREIGKVNLIGQLEDLNKIFLSYHFNFLLALPHLLLRNGKRKFFQFYRAIEIKEGVLLKADQKSLSRVLLKAGLEKGFNK